MDEYFANGVDDYYAGIHLNPNTPGTAAFENWAMGHDHAAVEDEANYADWHASISPEEERDFEAEDCYWSAVEQGMYDDDPSPYAGDYSEM